MRSVIVITKDHFTEETIKAGIGEEYSIVSVKEKKHGLDLLGKRRFDFVFIDIDLLLEGLPKNDVNTALLQFHHIYPTLDIIVMSNQETIRQAVRAVKAGASDYLTYPVDPEEVKHVRDNIQKSIEINSELNYLRGKFWRIDSLNLIRTNSEEMQRVFDNIRSVAPTRSTVLLVGETGTGKGVLAGLIHQHSNRMEKQFISVHCGAIPDTLLESELFGHEKGAFTGAVRRKLGKFEVARGGTIFLDEIGTITPSAQIKLLQILQDGTFSRIGGEGVQKTDVRIIAATNSDLKKMCNDGLFRTDLFYRLNVFPIEIPPLRERLEDIPLFCEQFIRRMNKKFGKNISSVQPNVLEALGKYNWPGNIRELENLIERAFILETSSTLTSGSFPKDLFYNERPKNRASMDLAMPLALVRKQAVEHVEKEYLMNLLHQHSGKMKPSAATAGITARQLNKLLKKYGIRKEDYKISAVTRQVREKNDRE